MRPLKQLCVVFAVAFTLNYMWEHMHAVLYVHYRGGPITDAILLHATFFDAIFTTLLSIPFLYVGKLRQFWYAGPLFAVAYAIGLERFALLTLRWEYTEAMPLIPLLEVGLSPSVQLGLIALVAFYLARTISTHESKVS